MQNLDDVLSRRMADILKVFGIHSANKDEIRKVHELATSLIGLKLADVSTLERVHEQTGAGVFVHKTDGQITGLLGFIPLNRAGVQQVNEGRFDALNPDPRYVADRDQTPYGMYGWAIAATDKESARRVVDGARAVISGAASHLPFYARPLTAAGERLMREKLGFADVPGNRTGLVWAPAFCLAGAVA